MHEHARALHVPQELQAQARALVRALDDPGDVGGHEGLLVHLDHAQHRAQGRERIVGDLGARGGDAWRAASTCRRWGSRAGRRPRSASGRAAASALRPTRPGSASRGARLRLERNDLLPRPPRPPLATRRRSPSCSTSPSSSPVSSRVAMVPGGTWITRSSPSAPVRLPGPPCSPRSARNSVW